MKYAYVVILVLLAVTTVFSEWWNATSGEEQSYYFVELNENNSPLNGNVWIKGSFSSTPITYYVYYNGNATSSFLDGRQVFLLFDDFNDGSINSTLWSNSASGVTESGGYLRIVGDTYLMSKQKFPTNTEFIFFCNQTTTSTSDPIWTLGFHDATQTIWANWAGRANNSVSYLIHYEIFGSKFPYTYGTWAIWGIERRGTSALFHYNHNNTENGTFVSTSHNLKLSGQRAQTSIWCNWVALANSTLPKDNVLITYANEKTGNWTVNGIQYAKRRQITTSTLSSVSNYSIRLNYTFFNSSNLAITSFSNECPPIGVESVFSPLVYEGTQTTYGVHAYNFTITDAYLFVNGTNYTATKVNSTYAQHNLSLAFVSQNATYVPIYWTVTGVLPNSSLVTINSTVQNQLILWASGLNTISWQEIVQQSGGTSVNATIATYGQGITPPNSSYVVLEFNSQNYTMTKVNASFFSQNLTLPQQTEFVKFYDIKATYFVNSTLPRNTVTKNLTGVKYVTPPTFCNDYLNTSKNIARITYQKQTYYVLKPGIETDCPSDLHIFTIYAYAPSVYAGFLSDSYLYIVDSGNPYLATPVMTFASHYPFLENRSFTLAAPLKFKMEVFNSSGTMVEAANNETIQWKFENGLPKICKDAQCILSMDGVYRVKFGRPDWGGAYASTWRSNNSDWFFNASYNFRLDIGKHRPYFNHQTTIVDLSNIGSFKNHRTGEVYSVRTLAPSLSNFRLITDPNSSTQFAQYIFLRGANSGYTHTTSDIANNYSAYLLTTNAQMISPEWSIYIGQNTYGRPHTVYYGRESNVTYATTLYQNVPTIIRDSYGLCYFVPPYSPSNLSQFQTVVAYQTQCESNVIITQGLPLLPTSTKCYVKNNTYIIDVLYEREVLFERTKKTGNVTDYYSATGKNYQENISLANIEYIELKGNGRPRCYFTSEKSLLGLSSLDMPAYSKQIIGIPLILLATALSMVNPFVFIFVFALNDMFQLLTAQMIFLLAAGVGVFAYVSNWAGERNLKTLTILVMLTGAYIIQLHTYSEFDSSNMTALNNVIGSFTTLFGGIQNSNDLLAIVSTVLPIFIINLIVLILSLPAILVGIIFSAIYMLAPAMAGTLAVFEGALVVGAYVWIVLKGYEMGRNMFRSV